MAQSRKSATPAVRRTKIVKEESVQPPQPAEELVADEDWLELDYEVPVHAKIHFQDPTHGQTYVATVPAPLTMDQLRACLLREGITDEAIPIKCRVAILTIEKPRTQIGGPSRHFSMYVRQGSGDREIEGSENPSQEARINLEVLHELRNLRESMGRSNDMVGLVREIAPIFQGMAARDPLPLKDLAAIQSQASKQVTDVYAIAAEQQKSLAAASAAPGTEDKIVDAVIEMVKTHAGKGNDTAAAASTAAKIASTPEAEQAINGLAASLGMTPEQMAKIKTGVISALEEASTQETDPSAEN